jgi:hypothetical protein
VEGNCHIAVNPSRCRELVHQLRANSNTDELMPGKASETSRPRDEGSVMLNLVWCAMDSLARIIHEGQGLRSADVREGGAWGAIGGVG